MLFFLNETTFNVGSLDSQSKGLTFGGATSRFALDSQGQRSQVQDVGCRFDGRNPAEIPVLQYNLYQKICFNHAADGLQLVGGFNPFEK